MKKGPFTIMCRGHSGSRFLCDVFLQNDVWMGLCDNKSRDAREFGFRVPEVRSLISGASRYSQMSETEKQSLQEKMRRLVETSKRNCPAPDSYIAFGWKRPIGTFTVELLLDACPEAKAIHLIRDGRDVMLSRLPRIEDIDDPVVRYIVFGREDVADYRGLPLKRKVVRQFRNELEMHHWVTSVRAGMKGRAYAGRYLEVFYEELCTQPVETVARVFDFLNLPLYEKTKEFAREHASARRIGKWTLATDQYADAINIGTPLLQELGYLSRSASWEDHRTS
jgi:hypothetical protein